MDGYNRIINVTEAEKECMECPNRGLKNTTNACKNCLYKALFDKIEVEKAAQERYKKV